MSGRNQVGSADQTERVGKWKVGALIGARVGRNGRRYYACASDHWAYLLVLITDRDGHFSHIHRVSRVDMFARFTGCSLFARLSRVS